MVSTYIGGLAISLTTFPAADNGPKAGPGSGGEQGPHQHAGEVVPLP